MKVKATFPRREDFQSALDSAFRMGEEAGKAFVEVHAGTLHRAVGGYPSKDSRMPTCCAVMRAAMMPGDVVLAAPPRAPGRAWRFGTRCRAAVTRALRSLLMS